MATYPIWAGFTELGVPRTGLTPTISIHRIDTGELVVSDAPLIEIGHGNYIYNFTDFDDKIFYCWTVDGGIDLSDVDRYRMGCSDEIPEITSTIRRIRRG